MRSEIGRQRSEFSYTFLPIVNFRFVLDDDCPSRRRENVETINYVNFISYILLRLDDTMQGHGN